MKQSYKGVWVIISKYGTYMPRYWAYTKKGVIEQWCDDIPKPHRIQWKEYLKHGWQAVKVNMTVVLDEKYYKGKKK